jgi:hypothetical protein
VTLVGDSVVAVIGEAAHQSELLAICGGRRHYGGVDLRVVASLVPRGDALEVTIEDRGVGHLAPKDAGRYRGLVSRALRAHGAATCHASIRGGWDRGRGDLGQFGVTLHLPPVDPAGAA